MKIFFIKLWSLLSKDDKKILFFLFLFSMTISVIETIGIAAILPFIEIAINFNLIESNQNYAYFFHLFGFSNHLLFIFTFGIALIFFYIFRSLINLLYFYRISKFSKDRYHHFAYRLFENYMGRSYQDFTKINSADLNKSIISEAQNLTQIFYAALFMISEIFIVIFIYVLMLYINWKISLAFSFILIINILFLLKTVSPRIKNEGRNREKFQKKFYEILNSTFNNFKMIKIKMKDDIILKRFEKASTGFALSNIKRETLSHVPRLYLEAMGFVIVILIILFYVYENQHDVSAAMAMISMFILGLYRLLPSAHRILHSYNTILYNYKSLSIIHNDLIYEIEDLGDNEILFTRNILLKNISFSYIDNNLILNNISLVINKGEKIAFFGESGSGKSTLVDIIMGLYHPKSGKIYIDDVVLDETNIKSFRRKIGYIPQDIYLFDGTVADNVAFYSKIDAEKVKKALEKANVLEFLENNHEGINTEVGENGLKLSGGQKQRIAIARALYHDPDILVLDEATSALDDETEMKIMNEVYNNSTNKTLIIISHRLTSIDRCDKIYKLENGIINKIHLENKL